MASLTILWQPVALVGLLVVAGLGPAAILGARLPADAQAAIAAPLGLALVACGSAAVAIGLEIETMLGAVLIGAISMAVLARARVALAVRAGAYPAALALAVVGLVSAPFVATGTWQPATDGNVDPYLWVSQARALLDGPAPAPEGAYPDRVAYERITEQRWPAGLPVGVATTAIVGDDDPAEVYSAFAVVLAALLALVTFALSRALLQWSRAKAAAAAGAVTLGGFLLFSTYYGWQAQIALTALSLASVTCFRLALEQERPVRECVLAGVFAAAAIATYGTLFGAFVPLYLAVLAAYAIRYRRKTSAARVVRVVGGVAATTIALGCVAIARAVSTLGPFAGELDNASWKLFRHGSIAEGTGLLPFATGLGKPDGWVWLVGLVALLLVGVVLLAGSGGAYLRAASGAEILLGGSLYFVVAILALSLPSFSPYLSMKAQGYGAPFLILTAFAVLSGPVPEGHVRRRISAYARVAVIGVFLTSTSSSLVRGFYDLRDSRVYSGIAATIAAAPRDDVVDVDVSDPWAQAWIVYYLRERRVILREPSLYFAGLGSSWLPPRGLPPPSYRVQDAHGPGVALWRGAGLVLTTVAHEP